MRQILFSLMIAALLLVVISCTGGGNAVTPVTPEPEMILGTSSHTGQNQTHFLWGLWQFVADPEAGTLDIVQLRSGDMHLNVLVFLEPPPMVNLTLESIEFNGNIIEADIGLRHPFLGLDEFTGFDVCGILITNGSITGFDDFDLRMAGDGDTRLLNPDGYSRWWNPTDFPVNDGTMFSYKDGLLGAPDSHGNYNSTLNAYKYFCDDLEPNDPLSDVTLEKRGMFSAGQKNVRHFTIELGSDGLIFNYAVDACWLFPQGDFPWTAPDDFAPEANRAEAWRISVGELENSLYNDGTESGGDLSLAVDVYDWFNADLNTIRVESPGNFGMVESGTPIGGGEGYSTYQIDVTDATPGEGSIDLLISVESETVGYGNLLPGKPVAAYFSHEVTVLNENPGSPSPCNEVYKDQIYACDFQYYIDLTNDLAFTKDGLLLHRVKVGSEYHLYGFDVTQNGTATGIPIVQNMQSGSYKLYSMDVDDLTGNIIYVVGTYNGPAVNNVLYVYKQDGTYVGGIDNQNTDHLTCVDTDYDGSIWTIGHTYMDPTADPPNYKIDKYFINHYKYDELTGAYTYDAAGSIDATSKLYTYYWATIFDCAISYADRHMLIFSYGLTTDGYKGRLDIYDLSSGTPVWMKQVNGFMPVGMNGAGNGTWLYAADIEIDHSNPADEYCRVVVIGHNNAGGQAVIKMDTDGNELDMWFNPDAQEENRLFTSCAINPVYSDPDKSYLTCNEFFVYFTGNQFYTFEMPLGW